MRQVNLEGFIEGNSDCIPSAKWQVYADSKARRGLPWARCEERTNRQSTEDFRIMKLF